MRSKFSATWYKAANAFITSRAGRFMAKAWHRCMPSFAIKRRVFGLEIYFDSRDHPFAWYTDRQSLEEAENIPATLATCRGSFWDVGANAGLYTLRAAALGIPVVAFDISPKAISYIQRSAERNKLTDKITSVPRAFSVASVKYQPPRTAIASNSLSAAPGGGEMTSITYLEAAEQFGVPTLIKMDIEGHEEAFLKSPDFKRWLVEHRIGWIVDIHKPEFWDLLSWENTKMTRLTENVAFVQPEGYQAVSTPAGSSAKAK